MEAEKEKTDERSQRKNGKKYRKGKRWKKTLGEKILKNQKNGRKKKGRKKLR